MDYTLITVIPNLQFLVKYSNDDDGAKSKDLIQEFTIGNQLIINSGYLAQTKNKLAKKAIGYAGALLEKIIDEDGKKAENLPLIISECDSGSYPLRHRQDASELVWLLSNERGVWLHGDPEQITFVGYKNVVNEIQYSRHHSIGLDRTDKFEYKIQDHRGLVILSHKRNVWILQYLESIRRKKPARYQHVINAIRLFNRANEIQYSSPESGIVLLVSAYESLLEIPRNSKCDNFMNAMKYTWCFDENVAEWAGKLYETRSKIVHGESLSDDELYPTKEKHYNHYALASEIFYPTIVKMADSIGIIRLHQKYKFEMEEEVLGKMIPNKVKMKKLMKSSMYNARALMKNRELYNGFVCDLKRISGLDFSGRELQSGFAKAMLQICADLGAMIKEKHPKSYIDIKTECQAIIQNLSAEDHKYYEVRNEIHELHYRKIGLGRDLDLMKLEYTESELINAILRAVLEYH